MAITKHISRGWTRVLEVGPMLMLYTLCSEDRKHLKSSEQFLSVCTVWVTPLCVYLVGVCVCMYTGVVRMRSALLFLLLSSLCSLLLLSHIPIISACNKALCASDVSKCLLQVSPDPASFPLFPSTCFSFIVHLNKRRRVSISTEKKTTTHKSATTILRQFFFFFFFKIHVFPFFLVRKFKLCIKQIN